MIYVGRFRGVKREDVLELVVKVVATSETIQSTPPYVLKAEVELLAPRNADIKFFDLSYTSMCVEISTRSSKYSFKIAKCPGEDLAVIYPIPSCP